VAQAGFGFRDAASAHRLNAINLVAGTLNPAAAFSIAAASSGGRNLA
jgi:hypothetical protein